MAVGVSQATHGENWLKGSSMAFTGNDGRDHGNVGPQHSCDMFFQPTICFPLCGQKAVEGECITDDGDEEQIPMLFPGHGREDHAGGAGHQYQPVV